MKTDSWKELLSLFFPLLITLFCGSAVGALERILLARYSLDALNSSVQAASILRLFQLSCVAFANMAQVFIGQHLGSNEPELVGRTTWQMIWLSLLSMLLIVPCGWLCKPAFFQGTEQGAEAYQYFNLLILGNFLFPLGATLSAFFLAQEKRWMVVWVVLGSYAVNLLLDLIFIFGFFSILPPLGSLGVAWATLISKFTLCLFLFLSFVSRFNRDHYLTHRWKVTWFSMLQLARTCGERFAGKIFAILSWSLTTWLMITKGGIFLSILSIGSTLTLFCSFLSESLIQTLSVILARYIGSQEYDKLWESWRLGIYFSSFVTGCLAIPFLLFPDFILSFFFSETLAGAHGQFLRWTVIWVWCWVFINGLNAPLLALLLASRDTIYYMLIMLLTWVTSFLPVYFCLYHLEWSPDKFWFILIIDQLIIFSINVWRVSLVGKAYTTKSKVIS